jgi:hypothetical protein
MYVLLLEVLHYLVVYMNPCINIILIKLLYIYGEETYSRHIVAMWYLVAWCSWLADRGGRYGWGIVFFATWSGYVVQIRKQKELVVQSWGNCKCWRGVSMFGRVGCYCYTSGSSMYVYIYIYIYTPLLFSSFLSLLPTVFYNWTLHLSYINTN